jgi:hypothetical protein
VVRLALLLALHGAAVLMVSLVAGVLLRRSIRLDRDAAPWRLAHAGGSGRGVMLLALAPVLHWLALTPGQVDAFVWLIVAFAWTSTAAMVIAAATGQRGLHVGGNLTNKLVMTLYVVSALTVFPAAALLLVGLWMAL